MTTKPNGIFYNRSNARSRFSENIQLHLVAIAGDFHTDHTPPTWRSFQAHYFRCHILSVSPRQPRNI